MKILVGHDGSKQSDKALTRAVELASSLKASLLVLTVVPNLCMMEISDDDCKSMYRMMTEESEKRLLLLKRKLAKKGVKMESLVKFGKDAETILKTAVEKKADLLIIGSHGRHGAKKFLLGSVSSRLVEHAPCDVLVVK
jgi:nucleotide-binding universal stress UspA family protein